MGSGIVFGQLPFPVDNRRPKTTPDPVALEFTIYRVAPEQPLPRSANTINRELQRKRLPTPFTSRATKPNPTLIYLPVLTLWR
jgi:hypothetical protein